MLISPKLLEEATHFEDVGYIPIVWRNTYHYKIIIKSFNKTIIEFKLDEEDYLKLRHFLHEYFKDLWDAKE